jgi:hypothetical protein
MNEDAAMRGANDKENQKYLYRNLSQCYLTSKISTRTGLALNPGHRDEREKVYLLSKSFWNIASL